MRKLFLAGTAALLTIGTLERQSLAACPEDIDEFQQRYDEAATLKKDERILTDAERVDLLSLLTAARELEDAGDSDACATVIYRANGLLDSAIAPQAIESEELVDKALTNAAGEDLGTVEGVLIDPVSGRVAYILVEHGGFLGIGDELFAIPWEVVRYLPEDDERLLIKIAEEKLEHAPRFSRADRTPFGQREWALAVHDFYGVRPYWSLSGKGSTLTQVLGQAGYQSAQQAGQSTIQSEAPSEQSATSRGTGESDESAATTGGSEVEQGQLNAQISEIKKALDRQSQGIDDLKQIERQFDQAQTSNRQIAARMEQLALQMGGIQKQLDSLSARFEKAALREGATGRDQAQTAGEEGSQAGSSQSEPQAAAPADQDAQASANNDSGGQCADQIAEFQEEMKQSELSELTDVSSAAIESTRQELKVAELMASEGAEESCLSALDRARESFTTAKSGEKQQSN